MNDPRTHAPDRPTTAVTTDRLRHDIDSGKTGDKVDHPDPAAAPLGTDEEAGGVHPVVMKEDLHLAASPIERHGSSRHSIWGLSPLYLIIGCVALGAAAATFALLVPVSS